MSDHDESVVEKQGEVGPAEAGPAPTPRDADNSDAEGRADELGPPGRSGQGSQGPHASEEPGGYDEYDISRLFDEPAPAGADEDAHAPVHPDTKRADEHLADLKRLQAEYVNYKRRVDRDRDVAKSMGVAQVIEALLPVLHDIHLAREHGELEGGPFAAIADKLESVLARFGVTRLGEKGEEFDPAVHEALMHVDADLEEGTTATTVVEVLQPGYKMGERVVRPARVSVADPS